MTSLPGFCTGTRLVTALSMIAGAFYPSGYIWAPANYAPQFRLHLHSMAQHGYQHIISTAPYLSNFDGRTIEYTLETFWSMSTHCKLCTNKTWKQNAQVLQLYRIKKVISIAKPSAKIYIAIFHRAGHPSGNNTHPPPATDIRWVRPCQPGHVHGGRVGEGSQRTALAHPTRASAPATTGAGCLRRQGQHLCPCGVSPRLSRLVTKQFQSSHHTAKICDRILTKQWCALWILTVNNLPLHNPWR